MSRLESGAVRGDRHRLLPAGHDRRRRGRRQIATGPRVRRAGPRRDSRRSCAGRCLPYGDGVTFWPIAEIVRDAAGIPARILAGRRSRKILDIARRLDGPTTRAIVDRVASAIGLSTTPFPAPELFWGIRKLLEIDREPAPARRVVDDIHVAAPTFLELLDHLLDERRRLADPAAHHGAPRTLRDARGVGRRTPGRADRPGTTVDSGFRGDRRLGSWAARVPVRERIISAAEGNPLYVEQIAAMLVETARSREDVAGSRPGDSATRHPADGGGARRARWTRSARGAPGDRPGVGDRSGVRRRGCLNLVPETPPRGPSTPRVADDQAVRSPDGRRRGVLSASATRSSSDTAYRSLLKRTRADLTIGS